MFWLIKKVIAGEPKKSLESNIGLVMVLSTRN